ncbi:response regulator transcription factor [Streptomyces neyagawaensis]|uniref:response regulator transcription factor n=1 Tax=Streptomyces neyagawaensis TaxID=42238 RepID=UPI0006E1FCD8|nr:helix-turn-helix transcriptional regulator [Streptomyces neyagawaensis]MCL6732190.1 DNA-binding response regulator [Streptomyces neyagawaensis]MDE1682315.1 DNA-binding response regulator [Streptomyces neyagawaensis]
MTTPLIVDDEPLQRLAVRMILERQPGLTLVGDAVIAPGLTRRLLDTFAHRLHSPVPDRNHDDSGRLHHLTRRERDVLARVASGRSNGEIAEDLHLAETTIKSHVSRILAKIAARTRVQAVAFAYGAGLVRPVLHM